MMFAKTVCSNPGSYVQVVPVGLLAKLEYNAHGLIEKIFVGYDSDEQLTGTALRNAIELVPATIQLTGGTTWVEGVFYSSCISFACGDIPECTNQDYIDRLTNNEDHFEFYAGHVTSLAASFKGVLTVRNWLNISGFNVLPGAVAPTDLNEDTLIHMMTTGMYNFNYPYIAGYMIYNNLDYEYKSSGLKQTVVKSVSTGLNEFGYIISTLKCEGCTLTVNASDTFNYNIHAKTALIYFEESGVVTIAASRPSDSKVRDAVPQRMLCSVCNKPLMLTKFGPVQCDDPNCPSLLYPRIRRMLSVLSLPDMKSDRFEECRDAKILSYLTDVLLLDEYKSFSPIECTLSQAIKACTPVEVCADDTFFDRFANACANQVDSVMYYAHNPLRIQTDLDITSIQGRRFVEWLTDPANALVLQSMFNSVEVRKKSNTFDGDPIFRGRNFVLTGKFKRGAYEDIAGIIASYSGNIVTDIDENVSAVLVGGLHDSIDGELVRAAKSRNIAVFEEDVFFLWHNIDEDVRANLL